MKLLKILSLLLISINLIPSLSAENLTENDKQLLEGGNYAVYVKHVDTLNDKIKITTNPINISQLLKIFLTSIGQQNGFTFVGLFPKTTTNLQYKYLNKYGNILLMNNTVGLSDTDTAKVIINPHKQINSVFITIEPNKINDQQIGESNKTNYASRYYLYQTKDNKNKYNTYELNIPGVINDGTKLSVSDQFNLLGGYLNSKPSTLNIIVKKGSEQAQATLDLNTKTATVTLSGETITLIVRISSKKMSVQDKNNQIITNAQAGMITVQINSITTPGKPIDNNKEESINSIDYKNRYYVVRPTKTHTDYTINIKGIKEKDGTIRGYTNGTLGYFDYRPSNLDVTVKTNSDSNTQPLKVPTKTTPTRSTFTLEKDKKQITLEATLVDTAKLHITSQISSVRTDTDTKDTNAIRLAITKVEGIKDVGGVILPAKEESKSKILAILHNATGKDASGFTLVPSGDYDASKETTQFPNDPQELMKNLAPFIGSSQDARLVGAFPDNNQILALTANGEEIIEINLQELTNEQILNIIAPTKDKIIEAKIEVLKKIISENNKRYTVYILKLIDFKEQLAIAPYDKSTMDNLAEAQTNLAGKYFVYFNDAINSGIQLEITNLNKDLGFTYGNNTLQPLSDFNNAKYIGVLDNNKAILTLKDKDKNGTVSLIKFYIDSTNTQEMSSTSNENNHKYKLKIRFVKEERKNMPIELVNKGETSINTNIITVEVLEFSKTELPSPADTSPDKSPIYFDPTTPAGPTKTPEELRKEAIRKWLDANY